MNKVLVIRLNHIEAHSLSILLDPSHTCRERRNKERRKEIRIREGINGDWKKEEEPEKKAIAVFLI